MTNIVNGEDDVAVDKMHGLATDGVDFDGGPLAVGIFEVGATADVAFALVRLSGVPDGRFAVGGSRKANVAARTGEQVEIAHVGFLNLKFDTTFPDVPKSAVRADAMIEESAVAFTIEARGPFFGTEANLGGKVKVLEFGQRGESAVDFPGDFKNGFTVFDGDREDAFGIVVEAERFALIFVVLMGAGRQPRDRSVWHAHPEFPLRKFGIEEIRPFLVVIGGDGDRR